LSAISAEDVPEEPEGRRQRLRRLQGIYPRSPIYFITACTARRRPLLARSDVHDALLAYATAGPEHGVWIGRFILLPDHLHFFAAFDDERISLSALMKSLKNAMSKVLRDADVPPPHWQKGFFDHVLRSGESYSAKWDYVTENAVRAGLVQKAADWRYHGEVWPLEYRRL
jgi:putative transposase